jgi:hypothetical protein
MQLTDESKNILQFIISTLWKYVLVILVTIIIMANCNGCNHEQSNVIADNELNFKKKYDSLLVSTSIKEDSINILNKQIVKLDSVSKIIKPSYRNTKKTSRDFIAQNPCDSIGVLQAFDLTVQKCDTVILVDSLKIMKLKAINENHLNIAKDNFLMLQTKDFELRATKIDLAIENKKVKIEKRKKIVAIGAGILAVLLTLFATK